MTFRANVSEMFLHGTPRGERGDHKKKGLLQEASLMTADSGATSLRGLRRLLDQLKDPQQEVV